MAQVTKAEALYHHGVLDDFIRGSVSGAPILQVRMSAVTVAEGGLVIIQAKLTDYFSTTGASISYSFAQANGDPLPAWLSYDAVNEIVTGTAPNASAGSITVRRTASAGGYTTFDDAIITIQATGPSVVANPVIRQFPEDAATAFSIPVQSFFTPTSGLTYSVAQADGTALPSNYALGTISNGAIPATATFGNNEILATDIRITATDAVGKSAVVYTKWESVLSPPVPGVISLSIQNDAGPQVIQIVDLSDDPALNLIVSGSVSVDRGTIISVSTTEVVYEPEAGYVGAATLDYTLEAGSGGPQTAGTASLDITDAAAQPIVLTDISTTSTDGQAPPVVNMLTKASGGVGGIDPLSFYFVNPSTGVRIGDTQVIAGIGTFTLTKVAQPASAQLFMSFASGYVGSIPTLSIECADRNGNEPLDSTGAEQFISFDHTQQASAGNPPPPQGQTIEPNMNDGLPIVAVNFSQHQDWVGENIYKNRVHYYSLGDPVTGYLDMAPGDAPINIGQLWPMGKNGYTQFDQGEHVVKYTVVPNTGSGGSANTVTLTFPGETESGSSGNVVRKVRTLGPSDTGNINLTINPGANGGRIRVDFIGLGTYENDTDIWHPNFLSNAARYKIHRHLDWLGVNGGKLVYAAEHIQDADYRMQESMGALPNNVPSPRGTIRAGYRLKELFGLAVTCNSAFWLNTPPCLGAQAVEAQIWAPKSNQSDYNVMKTAIGANIASIFANAEIQFRAYFDNVAQSAIDASYPDQRVLIVELGNEPWNFGSRSFKNTAEYWSALGGQLSAGDPLVSDLGTGYGYVMAIMARACKERFAIHKPNQQIVFVMNVQTGSGTNRNGNMRDAFNQYNASVSGGASMMDVFLGLTSYIQGGFNWNNNQSPGAGNPFGSTTEAEFFADFQASHQAGEAAHFQLLKDWYLNPTSKYKSVANVVNYHKIQLADAIANGMGGIIQYEGSFHDIGDKLVAAYPAAAGAWNNWMNSTYSRDVLRGLIAQMRAINPTNPARASGWRPTESVINNYQDVHRNFGSAKPWVLRTPDQIVTGLTNHAYEAYSEILRGSAGAPPPAPPPTQPPATQLDEDFSVNDTIAKLGNAGWSMSGNDWQIEVEDGGKNVLRGTSASNNAQYSFRQSLQANPYLTMEMRLASAVASKTGTIIRMIEQARNARFELWNSGSEIVVSYPYIPGTSSQGTLFTTGPGSNPAWTSVGDIRDQTFKTLRFILEPNLVRLEVWNGSAFVTAGEATTNLDPNNVNGIWHALDLRYDRWFSHFEDLTP